MDAANEIADIDPEAPPARPTNSAASTTVARKVSPAPDLPATDAKPEPDSVVQFVPWIPYLPLFGGVMAFIIYVVGWIVLVSK